MRTTTRPPAYAELQATTNFTFLTGGSHPAELVAQAKALGLAALAITDRNTLAGVVRAHTAARQVGLRIIPGTRLDLEDAPSLLCLPTDRAAYGRLSKLLSLGQIRADKGKCILRLADLADHAEGQILIAVAPDDWDWREVAHPARAGRPLHPLGGSIPQAPSTSSMEHKTAGPEGVPPAGARGLALARAIGATSATHDNVVALPPQTTRTFEADLEGAKAEVNRLESQVQVTKAEAERAVRLRATGGLAQEDYLQKIGARDQAVATLRKAQADVRSRELELSFCKIHAPIDGQISRTLVTEGNLVGYSEPTLLTTIVKYDPIYVYFDGTERGSLEYDRLVREQGVASAEQGRVPVHVGLATDKDYPNKGVVDFRDNRVDPNTGTVRLRAVLKNADKVIRPGLFSRLRIPIGKPQERLLVPEAALSSDPRGRYLLAVDGENVVQYRPVKVLPNTYGGFYAVEDGLKPDEWVVVNGLQRARPGLKVEPKRETLTPPKLADDGAVGN